MKQRHFHATSELVSEVGLGTWQLGGTEWGNVPKDAALATLRAACESGVNFIDTADIYGGGRSESLIGEFLAEVGNRDEFFVATKFGRGSEPGWPANFEKQNVIAHCENSLKRLGVESINLTQTHCLPQDELDHGEVWEALRELKSSGKIRAFGASVESMDEALQCLQVEGLGSLQIIFNIFRQKPIDQLFELARERKVALIIRLPLASGLLSGKMDRSTSFDESDHRNFNRDGQAFNVGETFAGLPFEKGVDLVNSLNPLVSDGVSMAQWAIRWCLDFPEVTTVIPGATRPDQAIANAAASEVPCLSDEVHSELRQFYQEEVNPWIRGKY